MALHRFLRGHQMEWELEKPPLALLDTRVTQLASCAKSKADFVRKGLQIIKWTGSAKCADLSKITEDGPGDYIFTESLPPNVETAVAHLLALLRLIKKVTCDVSDPLARAGLRSAKDKVAVLLCHYERLFPRSEVCRVSHIVLHVCDMVQRWNNVRNFWCFLTERYCYIHTYG